MVDNENDTKNVFPLELFEGAVFLLEVNLSWPLPSSPYLTLVSKQKLITGWISNLVAVCRMINEELVLLFHSAFVGYAQCQGFRFRGT